MALWRSTTYTEYVSAQGPGASPEISLSNEASWATRIFDVPWINQIQAVDDFIGYAVIQPTFSSYPNPTAYIHRITPMPFPFYAEQIPPGPGVVPKYSMWCTKINRIQGHKLIGGAVDFSGMPLACYQNARMELGFESLPFDILDDSDAAIQGSLGLPDESLLTRYVTRLPAPSSEYVTLNQAGSIFKYCGTGLPNLGIVPFGVPKIIVNYDLHLRWELVPREALPSTAFNSTLTIGPPSQGNGAQIEYCLGRVNQSSFAGYDPGTLLLLAVQMTPIKGVNARRLLSVDYFFKLRTFGHHKIFGPVDGTTGGFREISTDGVPYPINSSTPDGKHIYDVAEFAWLFRPPITTGNVINVQQPAAPATMNATINLVQSPGH